MAIGAKFLELFTNLTFFPQLQSVFLRFPYHGTFRNPH